MAFDVRSAFDINRKLFIDRSVPFKQPEYGVHGASTHARTLSRMRSIARVAFAGKQYTSCDIDKVFMPVVLT